MGSEAAFPGVHHQVIEHLERENAHLQERVRDVPTLLSRISNLMAALDKAQKAYHFSASHSFDTDPPARYTCQSGLCAELLAVLTVQRTEAENVEDASP